VNGAGAGVVGSGGGNTGGDSRDGGSGGGGLGCSTISGDSGTSTCSDSGSKGCCPGSGAADDRRAGSASGCGDWCGGLDGDRVSSPTSRGENDVITKLLQAAGTRVAAKDSSSAAAPSAAQMWDIRNSRNATTMSSSVHSLCSPDMHACSPLTSPPAARKCVGCGVERGMTGRAFFALPAVHGDEAVPRTRCEVARARFWCSDIAPTR
jgi:hypothetical protein